MKSEGSETELPSLQADHPPEPPSQQLREKLAEFKQLHDDGLIDADEYKAMKERLLAAHAPAPAAAAGEPNSTWRSLRDLFGPASAAAAAPGEDVEGRAKPMTSEEYLTNLQRAELWSTSDWAELQRELQVARRGETIAAVLEQMEWLLWTDDELRQRLGAEAVVEALRGAREATAHLWLPRCDELMEQVVALVQAADKHAVGDPNACAFLPQPMQATPTKKLTVRHRPAPLPWRVSDAAVYLVALHNQTLHMRRTFEATDVIDRALARTFWEEADEGRATHRLADPEDTQPASDSAAAGAAAAAADDDEEMQPLAGDEQFPVMPEALSLCGIARAPRVYEAQVVVGDVVHLAAGERVLADMRVVRASADFAVGAPRVLCSDVFHTRARRSDSVDPAADVFTAENMVFAGTVVAAGVAVAVVVATGDFTVEARASAWSAHEGHGGAAWTASPLPPLAFDNVDTVNEFAAGADVHRLSLRQLAARTQMHSNHALRMMKFGDNTWSTRGMPVGPCRMM